MDKPFVVEGELVLVEQEAGYAADKFRLGRADLARLVAQHFGAERVESKSEFAHTPIGRVRITIERLG